MIAGNSGRDPYLLESMTEFRFWHISGLSADLAVGVAGLFMSGVQFSVGGDPMGAAGALMCLFQPSSRYIRFY